MRYKNKYKSSENYQVSAKTDPKEIVYELLNGLNNRLALCIKSIEKKELDPAFLHLRSYF